MQSTLVMEADSNLITRWRSWFAWFPVQLQNGMWVWLRIVERAVTGGRSSELFWRSCSVPEYSYRYCSHLSMKVKLIIDADIVDARYAGGTLQINSPVSVIHAEESINSNTVNDLVSKLVNTCLKLK